MRLPRRLRFKRIRVIVDSPEWQRLRDQMQERIDGEHRWVHRLEDRVEELRVALQDVQRIARNGLDNTDMARSRLGAIDDRVARALGPFRASLSQEGDET